MQDIEFVERHEVDVALDERHRLILARRIQQQPAPAHARLVADPYARNTNFLYDRRLRAGQLPQRHGTVEQATGIGRRDQRHLGGHVEHIGFRGRAGRAAQCENNRALRRGLGRSLNDDGAQTARALDQFTKVVRDGAHACIAVVDDLGYGTRASTSRPAAPRWPAREPAQYRRDARRPSAPADQAKQ